MTERNEPRGFTRAIAETVNDSSLTATLKKAEEKFDIETGVRFKDDGQYMVSVLFYPKVRFFIQKMDPKDYTLGEARELTKEEYDQTHGLRL